MTCVYMTMQSQNENLHSDRVHLESFGYRRMCSCLNVMQSLCATMTVVLLQAPSS